MEQINAFGKLKPTHIATLLTSKPEEIGINVDGDSAGVIPVEVFTAFKFLPREAVDSKMKITFITPEVELSIGGGDYLYWSETEKRISKLFNVEAPKQVKTSTKTVMTIAVANLTEDGLQDIKSCTGIKKDLVVFMNDEIRNRTIDNGEDVLIVFKFDYVEADDNDIAAWLSLDELAEKGLIELR